MATKKSLNERIEETKERITQYENQMKLLMQKQKDEERKARTKRLIERGAILESLIDGAAALTNEQVKTILTAALNSDAALETLISMQEPQVVEPAPEQRGAESATGTEQQRRAGA